jgi:hypothetical protein
MAWGRRRELCRARMALPRRSFPLTSSRRSSDPRGAGSSVSAGSHHRGRRACCWGGISPPVDNFLEPVRALGTCRFCCIFTITCAALSQPSPGGRPARGSARLKVPQRVAGRRLPRPTHRTHCSRTGRCLTSPRSTADCSRRTGAEWSSHASPIGGDGDRHQNDETGDRVPVGCAIQCAAAGKKRAHELAARIIYELFIVTGSGFPIDFA